MARIFIDGEAGTTGLQIRQRLEKRSDLELLVIGEADRKNTAARAEMLNMADVAILCLPDGAARESVSLIRNQTTRVIDASTAFRVAEDWVYGFAEMDEAQSDRIRGAARVANPGCYPQGPILFFRTLIRAGLLPADYPLTINAISGYSGGGRRMIEAYEAQGDAAAPYFPYGLDFHHKHVPEMVVNGTLARPPLFQPAVGNYAQGMMTLVPLHLDHLEKKVSGADIHGVMGEHLARIANSHVDLAGLNEMAGPDDLNPQALNGTDRMRLHVFADEERRQALLVAIYDNLGKGSSGAAVQNLDLMLGRT